MFEGGMTVSSDEEKEKEIQAKKEALDRLLEDLGAEQRPSETEGRPPADPGRASHQSIRATGTHAKVAGGNFYDFSSPIPLMGKDNPNAIICPQCLQITGRQTPECKGSLNCGYPVKRHFDAMDKNIADLEQSYFLRFAGAVAAPFILGALYKDIPSLWVLCLLTSGMLAYRGYEKYQACERAKAERRKFIPT